MLTPRRRRQNAEIVEALHDSIVAAARQPDLFLRAGAPDTPFGRIESVMLHTFIVVRRLRALPEPAPQLAQALVDRMFADFERALRQIGIGDMSIPKQMKALGGDWLGRVEAYAAPLDRRDAAALAAALARNVLGRDGEPDAARLLADYTLAGDAAISGTSLEAIQSGALPWPRLNNPG